MKLIICPACSDVRALHLGTRVFCLCVESWGEYVDGVNAVVGGRAIPLGFDNWSLTKAMVQRPQEGDGVVFTAFVIPVVCESVRQSSG